MMGAAEPQPMDVLKIVLTLAGLLISLVIHEQMHARVAFWLGDPTGKDANRFSWNPIHHLDPFMSLVLPALLYYISRGQFTFGGAKPCPINPMNFRNPSLGMCLSAAAGPLSNYALAALGFGACVALCHGAPSAVLADGRLTPNGYFFVSFVITNVVLGTFNLVPIPPLDGSRILRHFSPRDVRAALDAIEPFGLILVMVFVYFGFSAVVQPVLELCDRAFWEATSPAFYHALRPT